MIGLQRDSREECDEQRQDGRAEGTREGGGGALTGDGKLKREGQRNQAVGKIKRATSKLIDKVK
jgi:uncharacterized protein YjbJ (UPF0337 family)